MKLDDRLASGDVLAGWRLVLAAVLAFMLPLGLAIAGATCVAQVWPELGETARAGAGFGGLVVGLMIGIVLGRWIRPQQARSSHDFQAEGPAR